jgi:hypothetical protein
MPVELSTLNGMLESETLELKREPIAADEFVKNLQAGLNGKAPLTILIGAVEIDGKFSSAALKPIVWPMTISGTKKTFKSLDDYSLHIRQVFKDRTDGYVGGCLDLEEVSVAGGSIIVVTVRPSPNAPHQNRSNHVYYIRDGNGKREMTGAEVKAAFNVVTSSTSNDPRPSRVWPKPGDEVLPAGQEFYNIYPTTLAHPKEDIDESGILRFRLLTETPIAPVLTGTKIRSLEPEVFGFAPIGVKSGSNGRNA